MSLRYQAGINLPGYNPLKVANAPTIGTATQASCTSVSVTFTAPSCVGGGAISSYTAYPVCGSSVVSGSASPLVVTGLTTGVAYTFKVIATNVYGPSAPSAASNSVTPLVVGQQAYTTAGTYTWVAPAGVTSVSVVAVGAGGGGGNLCGTRQGDGGGLGYKNNYTVVPGNSYTVVAGAGGSSGGNGGDSYFVSTAVVKGGGGKHGCGGTYTGDGGGNGGIGGAQAAQWGGAGGAGGYAGAGGNGATGNGGSPTAGSGGGGGGAKYYGLGGGVGLLGQGCNGIAGTASVAYGGGGSGGGNGCGTGLGLYGGGGGSGGGYSSSGARGAVRIIWPGTTRSFPSTNTGNL